jgi:acyl-CoA synthetase (AMP-forming)/AMP-acid ligase II
VCYQTDFFLAAAFNLFPQPVNASINESGVGVVGIQGPLLKKVLGSPIIVKFDVETEMPIRGKDGFCIEADAGEPGEILGRVPDYAPDAKVYPGYYEGYHGDQKATDKKLLRDVFVKGDCWVRTGDLLKRDRNGVIRFVDRWVLRSKLAVTHRPDRLFHAESETRSGGRESGLFCSLCARPLPH